MDELKHLFTERVLRLVSEAHSLKSDRAILFQVMQNPQMLHDSGGAAVQTDEKGQETIYLDPKRATEQMVAHELMHITLHRSCWPQMYSISLPEDTLAGNIADTVDNILDQYIFDPRLASYGFELTEARDWYVVQLVLLRDFILLRDFKVVHS